MRTKKSAFLIFILLFNLSLSLLNGCATNTGSNETIQDQSLHKDLDIYEYQTQLTKLEEELNQLKQENQRLKDNLVALTRTDYQYFLDNYYYQEDEIQTMLGYKHYNGDEPLRALPYSNAPELNRGFSSEVTVISTVRNRDNEHWALVEFPAAERGRNNYGFLKVEYLEDYLYTGQDYSKLDLPISIEGIKIGEPLEKAIAALGLNYYEIRAGERGFIHYGETIGSRDKMILGKGIDIFNNMQTHQIWRIRMDGEGYETSEGYGAGSNAMEAINYYKAHYPMDENFRDSSNTKYWIFEIGDEFVLNLEINTQELTEDSRIKRIDIGPRSRINPQR
ncbi:MAG: hypothetical protein ACM3TR_15850 [Caulobacteraceae bacterium]